MRRPSLIVLLAGAGLMSTATCGAELGHIRLNEYLGATFAPQALHYVIEIKPGKIEDVSRCTLRDSAGQPVLAQFKPMDAWDDGSIRQLEVGLVSGLSAHERKTFTVDDSGQSPRDDGQFTAVVEGGDIVFASPLVAVRIPAESKAYGGNTRAAAVPPPIAQVRGRAKWYGRGWLDADMAVTNRSAKIVADGPISKQAAVEYTFANGETYTVAITLNRGEELVRVKEDFTLPFTELSRCEFNFDLAAGLAPDMSVCPQAFKPGPSALGIGSLWDVSPYAGEMFPITYDENAIFGELAPWTVSANQWVHFACYNSAPGGDMLGIINTAPDKWDHIAYNVLPGQSWKLVQNPHAFFTFRRIKNVPVTMGTDKSLVAHFKLTTGRREWAFFVSDAFPRPGESVAGGGDEAAKKTAGPAAPRDFFKVKTRDYSLNALDRLKDYVLEWPRDTGMTYPRLYADKAGYESRRAAYNAWWAPGGPERIPSLDDQATREKLRELLLKVCDATVAQMLVNPGPPHHVTNGGASPYCSTYLAANLADLLLGSGALTAEEEAAVRAKLAFMAYVLNWHGYWAPEKGHAANPNMSSFVYDGVGLLGMLLGDHPQSATWIKACTTQLDRELEDWVSADGGWIECIHYTLATWSEHTMSMAALKNLGIKDYYRHPKMRRFLAYFLAMQTPPDPEFNRQRGQVQIGNSFIYENNDEFAMWAHGVGDSDPTLAGNLAWMWKEHGYGNQAEMQGKVFLTYGATHTTWWGTGLGAPPYYELALKDHTIKPIPPVPSGGAAFTGFGAVLQAHVPGGKETKLFFRQGQTYSHWDIDQGSFVLWAKGAPLCMDHGYGEFHPWLHNRISVNHMWDESLGDVTSFFTGLGGGLIQGEETIDTLSPKEYAGVKAWPMQPEPISGRVMATPWTRRVLFLNDDDPDGANYFVVRDTIRGQLPSEWTLWFYGDIADRTAAPIVGKGKFGVDLLVYLLDADAGKVSGATVELPPNTRGQSLIHLRRPAGRGVLAVLFPTLPDKPAPKVTALPDGVGAKIETTGRTDWVFAPEERAAATVDGVEFSGIAGSFSQRGGKSHYLIERHSRIAAQGLGVACNFPIDLMLEGNVIRGASGSTDAAPVLVLTGPVAQRVKSVTVDGSTRPLAPADGRVQISLPLGRVAFEIALQ